MHEECSCLLLCGCARDAGSGAEVLECEKDASSSWIKAEL